MDPYAPSRICTGEAGAASQTIERDELEAFVGKNGRVYWDLLGSSVGSRSPFVGFNVAAAALPVPWLLYRKMYVEFAVATLVLALVHLGLLLSVGGGDSSPTLAPAYLLLVVVVGSTGNGLYLRRLRRAVLGLRASEPDRERRLVLLAKRGGTTLVVPLVFALLSGALVVLRRLSAAGWGGP